MLNKKNIINYIINKIENLSKIPVESQALEKHNILVIIDFLRATHTIEVNILKDLLNQLEI